MEYKSLGIFETNSVSGAVKAVNEMSHIKEVKFIHKEFLGNGIVTFILSGNLGALQAAINSGKACLSDSNDFRHAHIIPLPHKSLLQKFNFEAEQS